MLSRGSALLARIASSLQAGTSEACYEGVRAISSSAASARLHDALNPSRPPGSEFSPIHHIIHPPTRPPALTPAPWSPPQLWPAPKRPTWWTLTFP
jgi:hypothetical protein